MTNTLTKQAGTVPKNACKSVTDAWNRYHSVPPRKDRQTFITPWGHYKYLRNPQGFMGAGDRYNCRFDAVLQDNRKERCVEDTIFWDIDLKDHWWRVKFLETTGKSGIVLNPEKFQFCNKVESAGFRISNTRVSPLPKYLEAIKLFPTLTNITDIRLWFGLVNQVAGYGQLRTHMAPF